MSYQKNVRIVGYAARIYRGIKEEELRLPLSITHLREAELIMLRILQERYFPDPKKIQLRVIKFEDGILRVKSKLEFKEDTESFRFPILLPGQCPVIQELIMEVHLMYGHGGIQFTLTKLREKYWIPRGRKTVTQVIRKCVQCRRQDAKPLQVNPIALLKKRVTPGEVFTTTGVDLAGPLFLRDKKKVWIVLYTCAVYRCVVLDLVESLSSEAFINSLERFINTHGRPNTIYSDNGTNFVGAENMFKKLNWKNIENKSLVKQIQWIFNPTTAAWWGGWWERLVRSVKGLLRRMLGRATLTRDELATLLTSVAATINERPLSTATEDEDDLIPLTPSMFMRGTKMAMFPEVKSVTGKELQLRSKYVKKLQSDLQSRFRKEYLAELVQRASEKKSKDPVVGDVVLIGADNVKRVEWILGRIIKLNPGKDGESRSACVKTAKGVLTRPLQRLYPLEVASGCEKLTKEVKKERVSVQDRVEDDDEEPFMDQEEPNVEIMEPEIFTRAGRKVKKPKWFGNYI